MATLPSKNALADLTGGYYSYWTDGTTEGRATLAVILGSTDAQAAAASFSSLTLGTALAVAQGGTGATTASGARTNLGVDAAGTDNSTDVTLAAGLDYLSIAGQEITLGSIDLTTDVTGTLPVANGGTGLTSISTLLNSNVTPATLGLVIGTNVQAWDADLSAIAALNPTANNLIYKGGGDTWDTTTITTFGRSLVDDANASTARTTLGLVIGTNVQAYNAKLSSIAGLTPASSLIIGNGLGGYEMVTPANFITNNNILDTGDIGVSVQAYNSNLTGINQGLATTDSVEFAGLTSTGVIAGQDNATLTKSLDGDLTLTLLNANAGSAARAYVRVAGSGGGASLTAYGQGYTGVANWADSVGIVADGSLDGGVFIYSSDRVRFQNAAGVDALYITGGDTYATGDLSVTGTGTFGTLTVGSGSITDTSGAISFGNENLTTTGTVNSGLLTQSVSGTAYSIITNSSGTGATGFGIENSGDASDAYRWYRSGGGDFYLQHWTGATVGAGVGTDILFYDIAPSVLLNIGVNTSITGTLDVSSDVTVSGILYSQSTNANFLRNTSATTGANTIRLDNSVTSFYVGINNNAASFFSSVDSNAVALYTTPASNVPIQIAPGNVVAASFTEDGNSAFAGDVTLSAGDLEVTSGNLSVTTTAERAATFNSGSNTDVFRLTNNSGETYTIGLSTNLASIDLPASKAIRWRSAGVEYGRFDTVGNLLLGGTTTAASAVRAFHIFNGTAPSAGAANAVALYSKDLSAGNTILGIRSEGSGILASGTPASANGAIAMEVNGTTVYVPYSTTAPS